MVWDSGVYFYLIVIDHTPKSTITVPFISSILLSASLFGKCVYMQYCWTENISLYNTA